MAEVACPSSKAAQLAHFPYLVPKRVFWLVGLDGASVDAFKNASDSLDLWMVGQFQNNLLHRCEIAKVVALPIGEARYDGVQFLLHHLGCRVVDACAIHSVPLVSYYSYYLFSILFTFPPHPIHSI